MWTDRRRREGQGKTISLRSAVQYARQSVRRSERLQVSNRDLLVERLTEREGLAHSILADIGVDIAKVLTV